MLVCKPTKMSDDAVRPNIRIEIHNNLAEEPMEVDDVVPHDSGNEEGEISDGNDESALSDAVKEPKKSAIDTSKRVRLICISNIQIVRMLRWARNCRRLPIVKLLYCNI